MAEAPNVPLLEKTAQWAKVTRKDDDRLSEPMFSIPIGGNYMVASSNEEISHGNFRGHRAPFSHARTTLFFKDLRFQNTFDENAQCTSRKFCRRCLNSHTIKESKT
ncbi:unnamed protein product [Porites evermanni]|uniref:Uncharacterized protein n=1 Tax=Porites evermanni TaxID=104178 RepID=A0ABN8MM74_9CNID|nr:unnamed protein product [Porites evermanni]